MNIILAFGWIEVFLVLIICVLLFVYAAILMSKKEKGWRFFGWLLLLLIFPFIGPACYIIYYFVARDEAKKNIGLE